MTLRNRLLARRKINTETGCWEWTGSLDEKGYGMMSVGGVKGQVWRTHRLAALVFTGVDVWKFHVLHACDNPKCFNPEHLFAGTQADNVRDMDNKGRRGKVSGSANGFAKLNEDQVREIKKAIIEGQSFESLAETYGITKGTISAIRNERNWAHVPWPALSQIC